MTRKLKVLRVLLAIVFFIPVFLIFVDFRKVISEAWYSVISYFQFLPSLIKFLSVFSLTATGFVLVIVLTVVFGRVYCSTICPLGVFMDIVMRISNWFKKKKRRFFRYTKPLNYLRYSILTISILVFLFGSIVFLSWLDPYSIFGRISTYFFKPILVALNNFFVPVFRKFGSYLLYQVNQDIYHLSVFVFTSVFFILITLLTVLKGRLYCNTICPVGALLSLFSKHSLFSISFDKNSCTSCSLCEKACKAQCIDYKNKTVDMSRCVGCFNCIPICKSNSVKYSFSFSPIKTFITKKDRKEIKTDETRRKIIASSFLYGIGLLGLPSKKTLAATTSNKGLLPISERNPITPPGSKSINHFTSTCTACSLCISACPTGVIQPSFLEYGILGVMQPYMDFYSGFCNYDCKRCSDVCPTDAISAISMEEKHVIQIGVVEFKINYCIVETNGTDCGACSEHCPTKAVHMVPYKNNLYIPEITPNICIGCGACEHVCPALPYKAIYVKQNEVHQIADKPEIIIEDSSPTIEDFPF